MKKKRRLVIFVCTALILAGAWFSTTNAYKFAYGYFLYQTGQSTEEVLASTEAPVMAKTTEKKTKKLSPYPLQPKIGEVMGELYIPKLDSRLPIYHGTDEEELEKGVGHYAGSVMPGVEDNAVLSGHRDTVFRRLGEVGENDLLIVTTAEGEFTYKVKRVRIVDEDDRTVIVPKPKATLTVSTCYPFNFIGSAPDRYILVAELKGQKKQQSL